MRADYPCGCHENGRGLVKCPAHDVERWYTEEPSLEPSRALRAAILLAIGAAALAFALLNPWASSL